MKKATPGPYKINPTRNISSWVIEGANGTTVASCSFKNGDKEVAYANAELIVAALNKITVSA